MVGKTYLMNVENILEQVCDKIEQHIKNIVISKTSSLNDQAMEAFNDERKDNSMRWRRTGGFQSSVYEKRRWKHMYIKRKNYTSEKSKEPATVYCIYIIYMLSRTMTNSSTFKF
jgi:hypothetical protein